ncbi:MAG: SusD/RagB family nutrient-binding outer membrane lipoprotein, partial [Muribaculaceae bacterium]|nr:SusD/RagB family nutrient-binding outer membrane lipoprotein [Muribaculaceae bacterium]
MKKISLFLTVAAALCLSSCNLDINDDPNYPSSSDVTPDLVFPAAENAIATAVGDQMFNYAGFFAQYFEQRPEANQYNNEAELNIDESTNLFDRCYRTLYAGGLADIKNVMDRIDNKSDLFACTVLRAYAFQVLVDNLDQVPYTEALQGSANTNPAWDKGEDVYKGVLAEMDEAEAALEGELMTLTDPMLGKSVSQWRGFANALRLRLYLRLIDAGINA